MLLRYKLDNEEGQFWGVSSKSSPRDAALEILSKTLANEGIEVKPEEIEIKQFDETRFEVRYAGKDYFLSKKGK